MNGRLRMWGSRGLIGLSLLGLLAGCSGRQVTTSAQDKGLVPGPAAAVEVAKGEEPAPQPETPPISETPAASVPSSAPTEETRVVEPEAPPPATAPEPSAPTPPVVAAEPEPAPPVVAAVPEPAAPITIADVFFDFDQFALREAARQALEANAQTLKGRGGWSLLIEGHCDERGTADYNLVLGERRAQAVKRYLAELGLPTGAMRTISYGKERPFCSEHSESCWQENRRAHFLSTEGR